MSEMSVVGKINSKFDREQFSQIQSQAHNIIIHPTPPNQNNHYLFITNL